MIEYFKNNKSQGVFPLRELSDENERQYIAKVNDIDFDFYKVDQGRIIGTVINPDLMKLTVGDSNINIFVKKNGIWKIINKKFVSNVTNKN